MEHKLELAKYLKKQVLKRDLINLDEDSYEDIFLRILVQFEEGKSSGEFSIEKKMRKLAEESEREWEEDA